MECETLSQGLYKGFWEMDSSAMNDQISNTHLNQTQPDEILELIPLT